MFLETICFKDGKTPLLEYHRLRVIKTLKAELNKDIDDKQKNIIDTNLSIILFFISSLKPPSNKDCFKCRVIYNPYQIKKKSAEFIPYKIKLISSLQLVNVKGITYNRKYSDRSQIEQIYLMKKESDDILIVREGFITDSSYCNIIFFDGQQWYTPTNPLIHGVMREHLLKLKMIREVPISLKELTWFQSFKLINAMRSFEEVETISIKNIHTSKKLII